MNTLEATERIQQNLYIFSLMKRIKADIKDRAFLELINQEKFVAYLEKSGFKIFAKGKYEIYKLEHKTDIVIYIVEKDDPNYYNFMLDNLRELAKYLKKSQLAIFCEIFEMEGKDD